MINVVKSLFNKKPVIMFGVGFFCIKENKEVTHNVTNIFVDNSTHKVTVIIEKGHKIESLSISIEEAERIGFIDVKKLEKYCSKI
jgi:hypothetical protein